MRRVAAWLRWASLAAVLLMTCGYLALLRSGRWTDEFYDFHHARAEGAVYWLDRVLGWSPRPFSELFLWGYGEVVAATGMPLIAPALALIWLTLILALVLPAFGSGTSTAQRASDLTIGLGLLILCLSGTAVTEMYFWPAGAAAYVLTLAGVSALLVVCGQPAPRAAALLLAAGTSEIGALFTIAYAALGGVGLVAGWRRGERPRSGEAAVEAASLAVPFLIASIAMVLVGRGRMHAVEFAPMPGSTAGDLLTSLVAAARQLGHEAFGEGADSLARHAGAGLVVAAVFMTRPVASFRHGQDLTRQLTPLHPWALAWALALAACAAAYLSLTAAYFHFGQGCCERHATLRHGLLLVACAATGLGLRPCWRWSRDGQAWSATLPGAVMATLALLAFLPNLEGLRHDWRQQAGVIAARDATWVSGMAPGPAMVFELPPDGRIVTGPGFPTGVFTRGGPATPSEWPMLFFGKDRITVRPGS